MDYIHRYYNRGYQISFLKKPNFASTEKIPDDQFAKPITIHIELGIGPFCHMKDRRKIAGIGAARWIQAPRGIRFCYTHEIFSFQDPQVPSSARVPQRTTTQHTRCEGSQSNNSQNFTLDNFLFFTVLVPSPSVSAETNPWTIESFRSDHPQYIQQDWETCSLVWYPSRSHTRFPESCDG